MRIAKSVTGCLTVLTCLLSGPVASAGAQSLAFQARSGGGRPDDSSLTALSRPANLQVTNVSVAQALSELKASANAPLIFSPSLLDQGHAVSCDCTTVPVRDALARILDGTGFRYTGLGENILIEREPRRLETKDRLQTRVVTGQVKDSLTGDAVTSGQVSVVGTTLGSTVKDDGTFTIAVPTREVTITVRSIGFKRKDLQVPASQSSVIVSLERDYFQLEAIVVTGQATGVERKNLANAVSTVAADQLIKTQSSSVDQALLGKVAGADFRSNSGAPGSGGMQITLRGVSSVLGTVQPLWVVDGVIVSNQEIGSGLNYVTRGGGTACNAAGSSCGNQDQVVNRVSDINPNDIQSVEVLKGASASAIYGSKANNGVILITTKRGREGTPQFSVSQKLGRSSILKRFGPFRQFGSAAEAASVYGASALTDWTPTYYDHEMEVFGNHPLSYETSASASGGTQTTRYFASGLINKDGGINTNTWAHKQSLRLNLDQEVGSRLSLSLSMNGVHSDRAPGFNNNDNNEVGMYYALMRTPSFIDIRQRADGTWPVNNYGNSNPMQTVQLAQATENVWRTINSARVDFTAIRSASQTLKIVGNGGTDQFSKRDFVFSPATLQYEPRVRAATPGLIAHSASFVNQMNATVSMVHTLKPASGIFNATTSLGANLEQKTFNFSQIVGQGLTTGVASIDATQTQQVFQTRNKVRDAGYFAQEEVLTMKEKLLLTVGIRADQSSTNSDPTKLYWYPKASASYRFNAIRGLLDEVKVRLAYGQSGNEPKYADKFSQLGTNNYGGIPGITTPTRIVNPLVPERQAEIETGVDATILGGRANLELTGYQRTISDLLLERALIPSTGYTQGRSNGATFRTRGFEAALIAVPIQSSAVQLQSRVTFSKTRTVITQLPVAPFIFIGSYNRGAARFVQDSSATDVWGNDTLPGCAANNYANCQVVQRKIGNATPTFTMGFSNDLKIKAVSFNMLWTWQQGGMNSNLTETDADASQISRDYAQSCVRDCLGSETMGQQRYRLGTAFVAKNYAQDATYLKLREASISVELPKSLVSRLWSGSRYVRLSVSGKNLLMFTPYWGVDPEVNNNGTQAIKIGFDDIAPYPPARTFWFTVDLGF